MARSVRPWRLAVAVVVVAVVSLSLTGCVADPPPLIGTSTPGDGRAVVSWQPPLAAPAPITAYVVTPWIGLTRQTPVVFNSTATTQIVIGLTNGAAYRFTVHAVNALGNDSAESAMSNPVTPAPQISAGGPNHTCAIVAEGAVECWGNNSFGQLGDGTTTNRLTPVPVVGLTGAIAIGAGYVHTCALLSDGTVKCWGANPNGQLGNGTTIDSHTPVPVTGLTGATALSVGQHSCVIVTGGAAYCWGFNSRGQLGNGTTTDALAPVPVTGLTGATTISAGTQHTCAVVASGTAYCWGYGGYGNLGNGGSSDSATPVAVINLSGATAITAGGSHTCALVAGGAAKCWGYNVQGELGNGTFGTGSTSPVPVTGLSGATAISAGDAHTCVIVAGGAAQCWGYNVQGQLGNGSFGCVDEPGCGSGGVAIPGSVVGLTDITAIDGGIAYTCATVAGGTAYCWGYNGYGQLGDGTTTESPTPIAVTWP